MFDFRSPIVLAAIPAGLAAASLAWFASSGAVTDGARAERLQGRLSGPHPSPRLPAPVGMDPAVIDIAAPLFALSAGPGAVADPVVRLDGLAISPRRASALLAIDAKPAVWMDAGMTRDGVTVMEVHPGKIVVDTPIGFKDVLLWPSRPAAPAAGPRSSATAVSKAR